MKMYVLDNGKIVMQANNQVTTDGGSGGEAPAIPVHSFLFDTEIGWVLFDTACDPEGMTRNWPQAMRENPYVAGEHGSVTDQLSLLGLTPDDIRYVVVSHLHLDHAGSLKLFRNATVIVSREEFNKTLHAYADRDFSGFHMESDISGWLRAELRWQFICQDTEEYPLCPGLTVLNFGPGHSYGMLGILAELDRDGTFLLAADTLYTADHLGPPAKMAGIAYDEKGYFDTVERIRTLAAKTGAKILFGHDMAQFQTLVKAGQGCYE